jgi:hypothetical protein
MTTAQMARTFRIPVTVVPLAGPLKCSLSGSPGLAQRHTRYAAISCAAAGSGEAE